MTDVISALVSPSKLMLGALALAAGSLACIPSFPVCDCSIDSAEGGAVDFPDFDLLNREAECSADVPLPGDDPEAACGYPAGPYGFSVDEVFANLELFDCNGDAVQIAQYLPQEGLPEVETRGVVFGVGALWCQPCQVEGMEWAAEGGPVDEYGPEGIQFIQALDQGISTTEPVTAAGCTGWSADIVSDKFPILFTDVAGGLQSQIQTVPNEPIPFTLIFDANANVRFRQTGGVVDEGILTVQLDQIVNNPYGN